MRVLRAIVRANVLVPIEEGTRLGVIPYEYHGQLILPVFTDELAFRRYRPVGGRWALIRGDRLAKILSDNRLAGLVLDGAGPLTMNISLEELLLGTEGPTLSGKGRLELVSRMMVGPITSLPAGEVLERIRSVCRSEGIEQAYLHSVANEARGESALMLGILLPPGLSETSRGPLVRRILSELEPVLLPLRIEMHFMEDDAPEIAAVGHLITDERRR